MKYNTYQIQKVFFKDDTLKTIDTKKQYILIIFKIF